jgi:NCAIR mutase (PurE)-related protein
MTALPTSLRLELDPDRGRRTGIPEIVYAPGKSALQVVAAFRALLDAGVVPVIAARCSPEQVEALRSTIDDVAVTAGLVAARPVPRGGHRVAVVTAGTADQHVADEAGATLAAFGIEVRRIDDVGVAGVHRLLARTDELRAVDALIVVAGMEGALPTAVAGLVDTPLIAVPTSTGYGSAFEGITALAAMTASCAPGVSVVGIDNGVGAACTVVRWLRPRPLREGNRA